MSANGCSQAGYSEDRLEAPRSLGPKQPNSTIQKLITTRPCIQPDNMAWLQMSMKCSRGCSRSVRGHITLVEGPEGRNTHLANQMDCIQPAVHPPVKQLALRGGPLWYISKANCPGTDE